MRALAQGADGASTLKARTLALWVAQNRLAAAQIAPDALVPGESRGDAVRPAWLRLERQGAAPRPTRRSSASTSRWPSATRRVTMLARLTGYVARGNER